MRHVVGGLGQNAKVEYDDNRHILRIWQKGWIGKRKYRVGVGDVQAVTFGWYTSRLRLPMVGFNIEFMSKGKSVIVTVAGDGKRMRARGEAAARAIGLGAGMKEYEIQGCSAFFSRTPPDSGVRDESPRTSGGIPLTHTEQIVADVSRGAKNIAGEVVSDAGNAANGFARLLLWILGGMVLLVVFPASPLLGAVITIIAIFLWQRNR